MTMKASVLLKRCLRGFIHTTRSMRTNIVIDDELMAEALEATGAKTKREVVELGLRTLVRLKHQERIRGYKGKLKWTGSLDRMRDNS